MKKDMIFGIIGLILVCSVGLQILSSWTVQLSLGADNQLNTSNPTLKDVGTNPEEYLGTTVFVEGYAIYFRCQSDSRCFNTFGDFWLSVSIENPGNIGIWINILDETQPLPPANSIALVIGIVVFVDDQGGYYRIDAQKIKVSDGSTTIQRAKLELFTDKIAYDIEDEVILTFANHGPEDINVILPNGAPFEIEFRDFESGGVTVFSLPAIQVLIPVTTGESMTWTLKESEGLTGPGYYKITFQVFVEKTRYTLDTNFTVGVPHTSLALFTNKEIYTEGEDVTLTFVNRDSRKVNAGYCFEISYQEQKNGPSTTYGLPCIEILVILPPGESITWTLTPADLKGPGYYTINYSVHYDDGQSQNYQTNFIVISALSALFTNKHVYTEDENVTLTFVNRDTYPVGAGYCIEISYQEQQYGPSTPIIHPCPLIYLKLPPGENITWILTPTDLMGPGYYTVNYSVSTDEKSIMFQIEFVIVATDELFTNKNVYIDGENVILTFENRASHPAYASYCFDIIYRTQETGPSTTYGLPCIEIEVIVLPGEHIAWTLTPADLKGPGHYSINYRIYRGERVEILQTEFTIQPKNTPVNTPFFVPGFGAIATIIAILGVLLLRARKKI
ncbi:MAG: PGF-CTERM sorting domain-containing protein [Candidatus Hodarchaeota archaeon]